MKRIGAVLLMLGMSLALNAQRPIYLFKEFTQGSVALKNRTFVKTTFNYDTLHDKLLYMDGDQIMELSDYSDVQSVFIGERMFIPQGKSLYEVVDLGESPSKLLIRWHQKKNPLGKKGAYDQITHASNAVSIDPEYYSVSLKERGGEEVFDTIVENSYGILTQGKFKKFTDRRSFLKQFSSHKTEIENYIDGNHLLFNRPDDVIASARYAVQL